MLVYSINDKETFDGLKIRYDEIVKCKKEKKYSVIIVGNKKDLEKEREVSKEEVEKFCSENLLKYYEVSAQDDNDDKIEKIFLKIAKKIFKNKYPQEQERGHRVKLGDELVLYPQISCSVKDEVDGEGNVVKPATADMLNVSNAKSTIGATIAQAVQQQFASSVSWKRVTDKDEEATTDPDTTAPDTGGSGTTPDTGGSGNTDPGENDGD